MSDPAVTTTPTTSDAPTTVRTPREERDRAMWRFVRDLESLVRKTGDPDRAALAALRSGLGKPPGSAIGMYPIIGDHLRGAEDWETRLTWEDQAYNDSLFVVASLFGLHPVPRAGAGAGADAEPAESTTTPQATPAAPTAPSSRPRSGGRPFLAALSSLRTADKEQSQALDRRIVALLNADREALPTLLRQAVGLIEDGVPVDWLQLLKDIQQWDLVDRPVQKRWAATWWTAPTRNEIASDPDDADGARLSESGDAAGTD